MADIYRAIENAIEITKKSSDTPQNTFVRLFLENLQESMVSLSSGTPYNLGLGLRGMCENVISIKNGVQSDKRGAPELKSIGNEVVYHWLKEHDADHQTEKAASWVARHGSLERIPSFSYKAPKTSSVDKTLQLIFSLGSTLLHNELKSSVSEQTFLPPVPDSTALRLYLRSVHELCQELLNFDNNSLGGLLAEVAAEIELLYVTFTREESLDSTMPYRQPVAARYDLFRDFVDLFRDLKDLCEQSDAKDGGAVSHSIRAAIVAIEDHNFRSAIAATRMAFESYLRKPDEGLEDCVVSLMQDFMKKPVEGASESWGNELENYTLTSAYPVDRDNEATLRDLAEGQGMGGLYGMLYGVGSEFAHSRSSTALLGLPLELIAMHLVVSLLEKVSEGHHSWNDCKDFASALAARHDVNERLEDLQKVGTKIIAFVEEHSDLKFDTSMELKGSELGDNELGKSDTIVTSYSLWIAEATEVLEEMKNGGDDVSRDLEKIHEEYVRIVCGTYKKIQNSYRSDLELPDTADPHHELGAAALKALTGVEKPLPTKAAETSPM